MNRNRVAIIGGGLMSSFHAREWERAGAKVIAVVDIDLEKAKRVAKEHNISVVESDYKRVLQRNDIDIIDIVLPHALHMQVAVDAANAKKHVLCEKPMSTTVEEAERMIEACETNHVVLMIRQNQRFHPTRAQAKKWIDQGMIGDLFLVRSRWMQVPDYIVSRPWYGKKDEGRGGTMLGLAIHHMDLFRYIVGEPESISCITSNPILKAHNMDAEDTAVLHCKFKNGVLGDLVVTNGAVAPAAEKEVIEFYGTAGMMRIINNELFAISLKLFGNEELHKVNNFDYFENEFSQMIRCVETGAVPLTDGKEVIKTMKFIEQSYLSNETNQRIHA